MEIKAIKSNLTEAESDLLVVNLFEGVKTPGGGTGAVDKALGGMIARLIKQEKFEGKFGDSLIFFTDGKILSKKVMLIGLGKKKDFDMESVRKIGGLMIKKARDLKARKIATLLHGAGIAGLDPVGCGRALAEGAVLSNYQFTKYKKDEVKKTGKMKIEELDVIEKEGKKIKKIEKGIKLGTTESKGVIFARDLVNEPANQLKPIDLVEKARKISKSDSSVSIKIYNQEKLEKMNAWAFLGVAMGSVNEPYLIHLKYIPKDDKPKKRIALVGKGLTFDSGGLNLKPEKGISEMKIDMAGAASVLGMFSVITELGIKAEVHGIIGACENMPSGSAIRPGDILTSMSGKTIEIGNTDAEGRVTMADTLWYAVKQKPDQIIDLATLTGAVIIALGSEITGIMGNNQKMIERLLEMSKTTGEKLWQLPLDKEYKKEIKGKIGEVNNIGGGRAGGAIHAANFLEHFVDKKPWVHLDIAGTSYAEKEINSYTPVGGTGVGVRLLLHYLSNIK